MTSFSGASAGTSATRRWIVDSMSVFVSDGEDRRDP